MEHISSIKKAISEKELDAILLTSPSNVFYACGFPGADCTALITPDGAWVFTDSRYIEAATNAIKGAVVELTDREHTLVSRLNAVIEAGGIKKLGIEERYVSYKSYLDFKDKLKASALMPAQSVMDGLRAVKSPEELAIMIKAQRIAEKAFNETVKNIRMDMTETELAAELVYRMILNGGDDKSFDVIAVSGEKSSMPHGVPENRKLRPGFLTIDFGVKYQGYCSDTTRTLCIGQPDDEMRRIYSVVQEAQLAGIAAAKGGVAGCDVDGAARKVIADAGYGAYFGHSFGHSLGIDIHESPNAAPGFKGILPVGAVISAEPGIYLPGKYGVRIEDVLCLTEEGCIDITELPKELTVIE